MRADWLIGSNWHQIPSSPRVICVWLWQGLSRHQAALGGDTPDQVNASEWKDALGILHAACTAASVALTRSVKLHLNLVRLSERVSAFIERLELFRYLRTRRGAMA